MSATTTSKMPPQQHGSPDDFQTPPVALGPLLPYIHPDWLVWEPACGRGNLVAELESKGLHVIGTDISMGDGYDFLSYFPTGFDCIITNPPYSLKDKFIARCYELGKPWAMLLPINALGGQRRQNLYRKHGLQILMLGKRIMFKTPVKQEYLPAWQEHAWFTWGMNLPNDITFGTLQQV